MSWTNTQMKLKIELLLRQLQYALLKITKSYMNGTLDITISIMVPGKWMNFLNLMFIQLGLHMLVLPLLSPYMRVQ